MCISGLQVELSSGLNMLFWKTIGALVDDDGDTKTVRVRKVEITGLSKLLSQKLICTSDGDQDLELILLAQNLMNIIMPCIDIHTYM